MEENERRVARAVRIASLTLAERVGLASDVGSFDAGKRADILVLNRKLDVKQVFIGGTEFHS